MGYGLLDAYASVQAAQQSLATLSGPDIVCNSNTIFTLQNGGNSVTWQVSYNLQIISSNNTSITVKQISPNANGQGFIKAVLSYRTLEKDVIVGASEIDYVTFSNSADGEEYLCTSHTDNMYYIVDGNPPNTTYQYRLLQYPNLNVVYTSSTGQSNSGEIYYIPPKGWYVFEVRSTNACSTSDWFGYEVEYVDCSQLDGGGGEEFSVHPNPASDNFTIVSNNKSAELSTFNTEEIVYELYDLNSSLKLKGNLNKSQQVDVSSLKKGLYILKIISKTKVETHRVIIE